MMRARKHVLKQMFCGMPEWSDVQIEEEDLPPLEDGQFLCEALFLSVDPYQRAYASNLKVGDAMIGFQVARILESRNPDFPVGKNVVVHSGWRDKSVVDPRDVDHVQRPPWLVPDLGDLPLSLALGIVGRPGNSAYFGLLEICDPQPGEVVVVSGAAGAVGSHAGQIAKIKGCKVIGIAGSDSKCRWLQEDLNFDFAFNYKTTDVAKALTEAAPEGVDVYFDNVGGVLSSAVISQMNHRGRISVCGSISSYNAVDTPLAPILQRHMVGKELRMEGFLVKRWQDRFLEGTLKNLRRRHLLTFLLCKLATCSLSHIPGTRVTRHLLALSTILMLQRKSDLA